MIKFKFTLLLVLTAILFSACGKKETKTASGTLYFGGDILTMEGDKPQYAEAIVQVDGKIVFVGSRKDATEKYKDAAQVDLKGKTLLPGFVDAHSHITMGADALNQANLNPEPVGKIENIGDIVKAMQDLKTRLKASDTAWLVGSGYDQDFLKEKRHPTKEDLDAAFPTNPVLVLHTSGHMVVANSAAMKKVNYTSETKDPTGGTIVRKKGTTEPEGLIQEVALLPFEAFLSVPLPMDQEIEKIVKIQEYYTSCGITTANDAMTSDIKMKILEAAAKDKKLKIDVIAFPMYTMAKDVVGTNKIKWAQYDNRLKYAALKMTVDGSPQGKTAYLTKAYQTPVPGCTHDCKGFSNLTQDMVNELFELCYKNNVQLFSHCNGDASIDMMIKGHEYAISKTGDNNKDRRTVIVHSQIIRPDQLDSYKKYGLIPSFFTNHTFYWGDVHVANLGEERASYLSPMKSALDLGLQCTNHTDYTVTPMDQMFILWTSVNRLSRTAKVIGPSECISPYEGLKAFTISAAHQYFEEKIKGSIKEGKLADFVILDQNPLKIDAKNIKDIKVLETIKEGKTVYTLNK
ncbi:MAG: amidohydrolase [Ignavibacteria bacterium]